MNRPYNYQFIPRTRGIGELPITTLNSYVDSTGTIDSSGPSILGLLTPTPVVTSGGINPLVLLGLIGLGFWIWKEFNKKERVPHTTKIGKPILEELEREIKK